MPSAALGIAFDRLNAGRDQLTLISLLSSQSPWMLQ